MSFSRRTFLIGAGSGLSLLVLAACTDDPVAPTATPTPTPTRLGTVPAPSSFLRSNWAGDPYARGATSYLGVGASPQARLTLREPVLDRVYLAGEALSDEPGTIRGAIESGATAARSVLEVAVPGERIAVIGAGAAGIEAARQLTLRGMDVALIEARNRTGGRIDSRETEAKAALELGAWRLAAGADDELMARLERAGVGVLPLAGASAFAAAQDVTELDADTAVLSTYLNGAIEAARQGPVDVSIAEAIEQFGIADDLDAEGALLLQQVLAELEAASGGDAADQSSWFLSRVIGASTVVAEGPLSTLLENALEGLEPSLSTVVVGVFYDDDSVSLRLGTGESLSVDRVIVTVPLGVLQDQAIEFNPVLPLLHRSALAELSVGHVEIVALEFEAPFWATEAVVWLNDDDEAGVRLWVNLAPITGQSVLLGILSGEVALALSELDDEAVLEAAQRSLAAFA